MSQDAEILHTWLADLHFDEYYDLFIQAGYDMPTIAHMTPQDLSAIGISNPKHRKQLKQEINKLYIQDGFPDYKPVDIGEWLHLLGLQEYYQCLQRECATIDDVLDIECEDLEEIGITKLGHQKKIQVAIERLKRIQSNRKRLSSLECKPTQDVLGPSAYPGAKWLGVSSSGYRAARCLQRSTSGDNLYPSSGPLELTTFQQPKEEEKSQGSGGHHGEVMGKSWPSPNPRRVQRDQELVPIQLPRTTMMPHTGGCARPANEPPPPPYTFYDTREHAAIGSNMPSSSEHPVLVEENEDTATIRRPSAKISPRIAPKPKPVAKIMAKMKQEGLADGITFDGSNMVMERSYGSLAYSCSTLPRKMAKHSTIEHVTPLYGSFGVNADTNQSPINGQEQEMPCSKPTGKKIPPPPPPKRTNSMKCNMNKVGQVLELHADDKNAADVQDSQRTNELPQNVVKPAFSGSASAIDNRSLEPQESDLAERLSSTGTAIVNNGSASKPASYSNMVGDYMSSDIDGPLTTVIQQLEQGASTSSLDPAAVAASNQDLDGQNPDWRHDKSYEKDRCDSERVHSTSSSPTLERSSSSGAIDTNTLPFANENVGTIKQRNPNSKTSIVSVNSSEDGDGGGTGAANVNLNLSVFDDGTSTIKRNSSVNSQNHVDTIRHNGPQKKVPPPVSPRNKARNVALSAERIDSGDVLSDIDNMLQDLTDELDAMLDLEVT
ncbi:hypothetical protein LSH36_454g01035 [Paralvinella palmiformis]|uniref:SAM domain-containing protein n=1 Tax=Paralvinella palmiformis TaxID=53620 RepID=A0AAD9JBE8_9ANNE|nr:hypothetical protein LSH36_454g01035 [Paralvinella palmiformis]